jgi:opacity protein-like surface antigen
MKKAVLAVLAMTAIGAHAAADEGFYVGLSANHLKLTCSDCSKATGNTVGLYGGYRVGNIAGEISNVQKTFPDVTGDAKVTLTDFSVIPRFNVDKNVDVLAKVGIRHSKSSGNDVDTGKFKATGNSLVVGVGIEYKVLPQVNLRAMVDYSNKAFGISTHTTTATIGVSYNF